MTGHKNVRLSLTFALLVCGVVAVGAARAATKAIDLDGNPANGAESQCDLNVLQTFPVMIETRVTNRAIGDSYTFSWPSAGPGGFASSVTPGSTGGVGAKWIWTTNQSVFSFTGGSCDKDLCFAKTGGPDQTSSFCNYACLADSTLVNLAKGGVTGTVVLNWAGGTSAFTIYRASNPAGVAVPANAVGTAATLTFTDTPPADGIFFYVVRGSDCAQKKACSTDVDCAAPGDGPCVSRGPFGVPGRSLLASDVTVSSGSLTSSLITFFSPPKELFRATSSAGGGGVSQTLTNSGTSPLNVTVPAYPEGCCPANEGVPHQLRCGDTCVDYLNDLNNCGACGNVCGDGSCCSGGVCAGLCSDGFTWCGEQCADLSNDSDNCGACGNTCGDGTCCSGGACVSLCNEGQAWCDGQCVDYQNDSGNCGACNNTCGDGTCCTSGACVSVCSEGRVWCNGQCVDVQNDSDNCGACGTTCGEGSCCHNGYCEGFCTEGRVLCGNECVVVQGDNANCGSCGNVCGDGTCCTSGACVSVCSEGRVWCNGQCVDVQNDSDNCGACGNICGEGSCCNGGTCEGFCPAGQVLCGTDCVDFQNDSANCGACGNTCGDGTCCNAGACVSVCPANQFWCNGACVDVQNDSGSCGACGQNCAGSTCCYHGTCVSECPAGRTLCGNECVDLQNDSKNCGTCGHVCENDDLDHDENRCELGHCEHDDLYDPLDDPPGSPPVCPNPSPSGPAPGQCPNPTPSHATTGYCKNGSPSHPTGGFCNNENPGPTPAYCHNEYQSHPIEGSCPNPTPTTPVGGYCPNGKSSVGTVPGYCPEPGAPPTGTDTPICTINQSTQTIPPGGSATTCNPGGVLFKEVPTSITVCGDGIPGASGLCNNASTKITTGTFNRLVPDPTKTVGNAYITPFAVHVTGDTSNDGLIEPGESADLVIDVVNAGPMNITNARAVLSAPTVDLTNDGVNNPVGISVGSATSIAFGTIASTPASTNCTVPTPQKASNVSFFPISVPSSHPGDTSHPMTLAFTGTVNGAPFAMNVPISVGIADKCDYGANTRDFDGLQGLKNPMARLVPAGEPVPFPSHSFTPGEVRSMKLVLKCGSHELGAGSVDAPEIVALSEATRGAIDVTTLIENQTHTTTRFFQWDDDLSHSDDKWEYDLVTTNLGTGTFTMTIRIAGRKDYVTGFVLH